MARRQLERELGMEQGAIDLRVARRRLIPLHRGVYAVGHEALRLEGRWLAAVLAVGPQGVLSHRDAAALWGIRPDHRAHIDVSTPQRGRKPQPGITLHRPRRLDSADTTTRHRVPTTTVARTLLDLASILGAQALNKAIHEAEYRRCLDVDGVIDAAGRARGHHGAEAILKALAAYAPQPTRSVAEDRFLELIADHGLPRPAINVQIAAGDRLIEADFSWPLHNLIAEIDGRRAHATGLTFESDRRRDVELTLAGHRVVRFTATQVDREPDLIARQLRGLLGAS